MPYRHATLSLLLMCVALAGPQAKAERRSPLFFKGPTAICVARTTRIYPCISMTPPAYRPGRSAGRAPPPLLPLEVAATPRRGWRNWFKAGDQRPAWPEQATRLNLGWRRDPDPTMQVHVAGPVNFKVYTEMGEFSQSRFFLGIDRRW